jgi:ParB family chromosome partitioning protein
VEFSHVEDMARSLREEGQHYAILVRYVDRMGRYQVADGETRLRAAKFNLEHFPDHPNSKKTIGAILKSYTTEEMALLAFSTAFNRKDLSPLEEARGIVRMRDELQLSFSKLAEKLGKPEAYFWERTRLLNLPEKLQGMIAEAKLSPSQAINLAVFKGPEEKLESLVEEVLTQELSVNAIRKRVKEAQAEASDPVAAEPKPVSAAVSNERKAWRELKGYWAGLTAEARAELIERAKVLSSGPVSTQEPAAEAEASSSKILSLRPAPKPSTAAPQAPQPEPPADA